MLQGGPSAILLTFIRLPFVIEIFVLSIFEWPFYIGFTVFDIDVILECSIIQKPRLDIMHKTKETSYQGDLTQP